MDLKDTVQFLILVGIALGGWFFAERQRRLTAEQKQADDITNQKRQMRDKVITHLDGYADLLDLYQFYARQHHYNEQNPDGSLKTNPDGKFILHREIHQPELRFEEAIQALEGTELQSAITLKIVQLRRTSGKVGDILHKIDPSGELNKQLAILHYHTTKRIDSSIQQDNFHNLLEALKQATTLRRELSDAVEKKLADMSQLRL